MVLIVGVTLTSYFKASSFKAASGGNTPREINLASSVPQIIREIGNPDESSNPIWWVNSGAYLYVSGDTARTITGALATGDPWRIGYAKDNPNDTDGGFYPQNLFRLLTRETFEDIRQEAYFKINRYNESPSKNRNPSNGILLYQHYVDGGNFYYAGLRIDGAVIVDKKRDGIYETLGTLPFFVSDKKQKGENVLPIGTWIGLRTETKKEADGSIIIQLSIDPSGSGNWAHALEVRDGSPSSAFIKGRVGIRTDFMDVEFKNYKITEL